jgi:hypothetical protein
MKAHALPSANKLDGMVQRSSSSVTRRSVPLWFSIFFVYAKKSFANFLAKITYIKLFVKIKSMMADMLYILGAFARLRKATIFFVMSVRLSVHLPSVRMEHLGSHWTDLHEVFIRVFSTFCREKFKFY